MKKPRYQRGLTQADVAAVLRDYPDASKVEAAARRRASIAAGNVPLFRQINHLRHHHNDARMVQVKPQ